MADYKEYLDKIRNSQLLYFDSFPLDMTSCEYNVHLLLNKMAEARKSYLLLMDHERFSDAVLIAGHLLENAAVINYISASLQANNTKQISKYLARETVQTMCDLFKFVGDDDVDKETQDTIDFIMDDFKNRCAIVVSKKATQTHEELMQTILKAETNLEKLRIIKSNYEFPVVEDYLRPFRTDLSAFYGFPDIAKKLVLFYSSYCKIKHCGAAMYAPKLCEDKVVMDKNQYRDLSPIIVWMCLEYTEKNIKKILNKVCQKR
mgnify:CR=1 FL=1